LSKKFTRKVKNSVVYKSLTSHDAISPTLFLTLSYRNREIIASAWRRYAKVEEKRKGALVKEMRARVESHSECAGNRAQGKWGAISHSQNAPRHSWEWISLAYVKVQRWKLMHFLSLSNERRNEICEIAWGKKVSHGISVPLISNLSCLHVKHAKYVSTLNYVNFRRGACVCLSVCLSICLSVCLYVCLKKREIIDDLLR